MGLLLLLLMGQLLQALMRDRRDNGGNRPNLRIGRTLLLLELLFGNKGRNRLITHISRTHRPSTVITPPIRRGHLAGLTEPVLRLQQPLKQLFILHHRRIHHLLQFLH